MSLHSLFDRAAKATARAAGQPAAFAIAALLIILWAASGPLFGYSDTWQLVVNTSTTIITFLMVFLIQSTQNRDSAAMLLKLDELIRALDGAHKAMIDLEELSEAELDRVHRHYRHLAKRARAQVRQGRPDTAGAEEDVDLGPFEGLPQAEGSESQAGTVRQPGRS